MHDKEDNFGKAYGISHWEHIENFENPLRTC